MKLLILIALALSSFCAFGVESDLCDILNIPNCRGVTKQLRRNTFQTAPTGSTAANLNPSNVSFDKGLGFEALAQAGNPLLFSLTSGTGKMGGALISGAMDNSFFGNRTPELREDFLDRYDSDKQYKNKKLTFALGAKLFSSRNFGLDVGAVLKRHNELKKINPGAGFSGRIWRIHFGASMYKDDYFIDLTNKFDSVAGLPYPVEFGKNSLSDDFQVLTYTVGTRIKNFGFDYGVIKSDIEAMNEPTVIQLYSGSFYYGDFLFNLAMRKEHSTTPKYEDGTLKAELDKTMMFYGIQYSLNRHIIFGVNYNYFLLNEASLSATFFI